MINNGDESGWIVVQALEDHTRHPNVERPVLCLQGRKAPDPDSRMRIFYHGLSLILQQQDIVWRRDSLVTMVIAVRVAIVVALMASLMAALMVALMVAFEAEARAKKQRNDESISRTNSNVNLYLALAAHKARKHL